MSLDQILTEVTVFEKPFGTTKDGQDVTYYELQNHSGMTVGIINYGGAITKIIVPDKFGNLGDVVFGHDNIRGYEEENDYFGCIAGRFANRIGKGQFTLDGKSYQLPQNDNGNSLHGGNYGFDKRIWKGILFKKGEEAGIILSYTSQDGEEGYPGTLACQVTYTLNSKNELRIDYEATTTKPTIINLTNHTYFNLKDGGASSILDHRLELKSSKYTPVDKGLITTGEIISVANTPFDFREPQKIGDRIEEENQQLKYGLGYDHNYALDNWDGALSLAAEVTESTSGRKLEVLTTEPGIQFYSGNFLKGNITGKNGITYEHRTGFCLETQHYPDSPNKQKFPPVVLRPDGKYESVTVFRFSTE